jgi:hypothetical protein
LQRGSASCAEHWCNGPGNAFIERYSTSATTGAVLGVNRTLGGEHGLALSPGDEMRLSFAGVEEDWDLADPTAGFCPIASAYSFNDSMCGAHDRLGVAHVVYAGNDGIGQHTQEVRNADGRATFRVVYEVRRAPLPDLSIVELSSRTASLVGGEQTALCVRVRNAGTHPSGNFFVDIWVEGETSSDLVRSGYLWAGQEREQCLFVRVPAGTHVVGARLEPTSDWNSPELPAQPAGPIYFQTVPGSSPAGGGAIGSPARQKPASTVAGTTPRR